MRTGKVYECVDARPGSPLSGIAVLHPVPGALEVQLYSGTHAALAFDDELEDDEERATVVLHLDAGKVFFIELTLAGFLDMEGPSFFPLAPEFTSTEDLQAWFFSRITES